MGLFKSWKQAKAVIHEQEKQVAAESHHAPTRGLVGGMEALANMMMGMFAPMWVMLAPVRGRPLPGTEPHALEPADQATVAAVVAAMAARDSAFDPGLLTTFADQVFSAMAAAWTTKDPGSVRSVLADGLWEPFAATLNSPAAAPTTSEGIFGLAALQQGVGALANLCAGTWYDSALVSFQVHLGEGAPDFARDPWQEEWLFQRSVQPGGDPMALPEACPVCGAPSSVDATGSCTKCRSLMPVQTAGWLVSVIHCHNPFLQAQYDQMVAQLRQSPEHAQFVPAQLRQLLPPDLAGPSPE